MHLTKSDILVILNWMKTKPYFRDRLRMFGHKETLLSYLKSKSEKQLMFILLALRNRRQDKFESRNGNYHSFSSNKYNWKKYYAKSLS